MARSSGDAPTAVSDASDTSGQAAPMKDTAATPTKAQAQESGTSDDTPTSDAREVAREDADWRLKHPHEARTREAREGVGGESFAYLSVVDQPEADTPEAQKAAQKAAKAAQDDDQWRIEHGPNRIRARKARAGVGGESFDYVSAVDQGEHPDNNPSESDDEDD